MTFSRPITWNAPLGPGPFRALVLAVLLPLLGCSVSSQPNTESNSPNEVDGPAWFKDVSDRVGFHFVHDPGPTDTYFMPQSMGSGCAFLDFDGDGLLDIYMLQDAGPDSKSVNRLYRQLPDHTFQDVTEGSGLDVAGFNRGVAVGDVNNDGLPDVLVTQYGGIKLFLNLGGGRFVDVHRRVRLAQSAVGDVGRISRLRPRWLAGSRRRQLPRLRFQAECRVAGRPSGLLRPQRFLRGMQQAVPQPGRTARGESPGTRECASRT